VVASGSTVLKLGDQVIDSTDRPLDLETFFSTPEAPGRYELTTTANRADVAAISTGDHDVGLRLGTHRRSDAGAVVDGPVHA
jgi:hypothetical protein